MHYISETMENAFKNGNLEEVLRKAPAAGIDLKEEWTSVAADAIFCNLPGLLKYLQQELQINFSEEIDKLAFDEREEINHSVFLAARDGHCEIIEYAVKEFKSRETFNAAFIGAAGGHQRTVLGVLDSFSGDYKVNGDLLNKALAAACRDRMVEELIFNYADGASDSFLQKDAYGRDTVDELMERTLSAVSLLLTGKYLGHRGRTETPDKAEQLFRLLKTYHKADNRKVLFQSGKKFLRNPEMALPNPIKAEIMKETSCPWLDHDSTAQMPSGKCLRGRLKFIRKRLIAEYVFQSEERIEKSGIPCGRQRQVRRQVIHALLTVYRDADSIADFHKRAQSFMENRLPELARKGQIAK